MIRARITISIFEIKAVFFISQTIYKLFGGGRG